MATVNTAPEEEKVEELSEKQLKILGILEARSREYMDAIEYVQNTTKDNQAIINPKYKIFHQEYQAKIFLILLINIL